MKKLMIAAAAVALVGGAFAECKINTTTKETAEAWQWKFTGKTTYGKVKGVTTVNNCTPETTCSYRQPTSLKIQGFTGTCDPICGGDDFCAAVVEADEIFWQTKPVKVGLLGGVSTEFGHIIGKSKKQYEAFGVAEFTDVANGIDYVLTYAGIGKYNLKKGYVKSVKGNFAGALSMAYNYKHCAPAGYWDCVTLTLVCEAPTVAYGKFSVKYSKKQAKRLANKQGYKGIPSWDTVRN